MSAAVSENRDATPDIASLIRATLAEGIVRLFGLIFGWLFGWPIGAFRRWLDRQPDRDPSQISSLEKFGRLALGISLTLCIQVLLGWLIFK